MMFFCTQKKKTPAERVLYIALKKRYLRKEWHCGKTGKLPSLPLTCVLDQKHTYRLTLTLTMLLSLGPMSMGKLCVASPYMTLNQVNPR